MPEFPDNAMVEAFLMVHFPYVRRSEVDLMNAIYDTVEHIARVDSRIYFNGACRMQ